MMSAPGTTGLELMIAGLIQKGIDEGDYKCISFILDRLGFAITNPIEVSGSPEAPMQIQFTEEQKVKIARAYLDDYKDTASVKD